MAKQEILISINLRGTEAASKSTDKLSAATKRLAEIQKQEAIELEKVNQQIKIQKDINTAAAKSSLGLADATGKTAAQLKASRTQSGLNNAILLETSRLASDAGYGFTAIANNLSQVITLFSSFTKTAGGTLNSIKQLGKSIIGSGGILIAIQLLIAFGPQIFDFFMRLIGFSRELRDAFKGVADTMKTQTGSFELYIRTLQDGTKSQEEMNDAIVMLNKDFPEYIKSLKEADLNIKDVIEGNKEAEKVTASFRKEILRIAMARQAQIKIEESAAEILEIRVQREAEARDKGYESLAAAQKRFNELDEKATDRTISYKEKAERRRLENILTRNQDEIDDAEKRIDTLIKFTDIQTDEEKKGGGKRERNFKQHLLNLDKLEESYRQSSIDKGMMTREEIIDLEEKNAIKELDIRRDAFIKKEKLRLEEFKESGASAAEIAKAEREVNESIEQAGEEHAEVMIQLLASFGTKRKQLRRTQAEEARADQERADEIEKKTYMQQLENLKTFEDASNEIFFAANKQRVENEIQTTLQSLENANLDASVKAQLYQNLFALQDELRQNDLNAEIAAVEAKKAINLEYVGFAEQTGSLLKTLAGESEALQTAALVVEKGAAIAKVVIEAQSAIAAKTAAANAIPAFLPPSIPNPAFMMAQAEAKASNTRTKIGAALAIANILATTISSAKRPKDTSAGGGGMTIQAPDFNVVGASPQSQLAEAVSMAQQKPVKAFVVGKDISTQQELDRNITNTASFG
jgi:hypothetical protein